MRKRKNKLNKKKSMMSPRSRSKNEPIRQEPNDPADELSMPKSPNVDRIVDAIVRKYNDFGLTDRD